MRGEDYCRQCGVRLEERALELETVRHVVPTSGVEVPLCPHCGAPVASEDTVCPVCVAALHEAPKPHRPVPHIEADPTRFCAVCGGYNEPDATVCKDCQTPLKAEAPVSKSPPRVVPHPARHINLD
jgi:predicted amidophosphoribosyltransferase